MKTSQVALLLCVAMLVACAGGAEPTQTGGVDPSPTTAGRITSNLIIAEAVIEPVRSSELHFLAGGSVVDIAAVAGMPVAEDDVLVRLDSEAAALGVQEAEAALAAAQAELALRKAGPQAEAVAEAEARIAAAEAEVQRAEARRQQLASGAAEAAIAGIEAQLEAARQQHHLAQLELAEAEKGDDDDRIAWARRQLAAADLAVTAVGERLDAQPRVTAAQLRMAGAAVTAAIAQRDAAVAQYQLLLAGSTAEEIRIAEASVQQAEASLASAQVLLDRTQLRAPFSGTVTRIYVEVGDDVAIGQPILVLATLDDLQARTTDLKELDVVRLAEGHSGTVTIDALPELRLEGHVRQIKLRSEDYRGDVVYPVIVDLDQIPSQVLWGMTALIEFEAP